MRRIRKSLTNQATQTFVYTLIRSNLDHFNPSFYGMPLYFVDRLQRIQNLAARVVMLVPRFEHITHAMIELHWLPVKYLLLLPCFIHFVWVR